MKINTSWILHQVRNGREVVRNDNTFVILEGTPTVILESTPTVILEIFYRGSRPIFYKYNDKRDSASNAELKKEAYVDICFVMPEINYLSKLYFLIVFLYSHFHVNDAYTLSSL